MKKVLVLVAALSLLAAPAMAAITGTAHDLTLTGKANQNNGTTEICVFCHTPHGADTTVATAPLWNRVNVTAAGTTYVGLDLEASTAATTIGDINNTDAPLCLSCHDGTAVKAGLVNEPNSGSVTVVAVLGANADIGGGVGNLSDDHPIGFSFTAAAATDLEIKDATAVQNVAGMAGAVSYGTAGTDMWCSSCHDVHNDTFSPFLRISNTGSALCLACHIK